MSDSAKPDPDEEYGDEETLQDWLLANFDPHFLQSWGKTLEKGIAPLICLIREERDAWWLSRGHIDGKGGCFYAEGMNRNAVANRDAEVERIVREECRKGEIWATAIEHRILRRLKAKP